MGCSIIRAGWHTTVQDAGRRGLRKFGIPQAGVQNKYQYELANVVLNNDLSMPVIEIRARGLKINFSTDHVLFFTGSEIKIRIDEAEVPTDRPIRVKKNQFLEVIQLTRNGTAYMGIQGRWQLDQAYGSYATDLLTPLPHILGRRLQSGDYLDILPTNLPIRFNERICNEIKIQSKVNISVLRLLTAPESGLLTETEKSTLEEIKFQIDVSSNSMGLRLNTERKDFMVEKEMISASVMPGTLQWPAGGQPILLLNQAQTTGGYPRIAQVISADLHKLSNLGPGDYVQFRWSTLVEAEYLYDYQQKHFQRLINMLLSDSYEE